MEIHNDDEFVQAGEMLRDVWEVIDRNLLEINNNLAELRSKPWRLRYNFKLLRRNRHTLRFINELLMSNLDLMAAREVYIDKIRGPDNGEDTEPLLRKHFRSAG